MAGIAMAMKIVRWFLLFSIICIFFLSNSSSVQGRYHFHRSRRSSSKPSGTSSSPPPTGDPNSNPSPTYPPPEPPSSNDPISDPSPTYPPPEPPSSSDPNSNPCVFNVMSYGAVGDGETDDTAAFKSAWDEACGVESGVLLAPSNYVFMITSTIFSGPCKQGLTFQVDGVLMAPNGPDCWPESDSKRQWLVFYQVDGMTLQGSGVIEGNGEKWWDLPCKPHKGPNGSTLPGPCDSPTAIRFFVSSDITVRGLHFQNSPQFHVKFDACENVLIDTVFINSPALSPNTDGIHIENTKSVGIYNSAISNGDDCISIGPGCADVDIENVTCGPSHGISIGSLGVHNSHACVSNVTVTNAVIRNSDNGVRIKTWQGGMGSVSEITFENVFMENVRNCIIIDQYYCFTKGCTNQTAAVFVTDVYYTNIKGTYDVRSPPIHFACSDTRPCVNITLAEVELLPSQGEMILDPFCWNAYGALATVTIPPVDCLQDAPQSFTETSATYGC